MPLKNGRQTDGESRFIRHYVELGDIRAAARAADVHGETGRQMLERPAVLAAIRARQSAVMVGELLPAAMAAIRDLLSDKTPPATRAKVAMAVYDRAIDPGGGAGGVAPHEMTAEQLAAAIARLEEIAAGRAADVTPQASPRPAPPVNVFD